MGNKSKMRSKVGTWKTQKDSAAAQLPRSLAFDSPTRKTRTKPEKSTGALIWDSSRYGTARAASPMPKLSLRHRIAARRSQRLRDEGQETRPVLVEG